MREANVEYYSNNLPNYDTVLRDTKNAIIDTIDDSYNCMGYALETFKWDELYDFIYSEDLPSKESQHLIKQCFKACRRELIRDYKLRPISSPKRARANERVIAMRVGADDFHFARLNSDGTWTHKPGSRHICVMTTEELYEKKGWSLHRKHPYNSKIAFFAIRRDR